MPPKKKTLVSKKKTGKAAKPAKAVKGKAGKKGAAPRAGAYKKQLPSFKQVNELHTAFKEELGAKIIPASKVRKYFKSMNIRSEKGLTEALSEEIYRLMRKAVLRAVKNNRKTVRGWDF